MSDLKGKFASGGASEIRLMQERLPMYRSRNPAHEVADHPMVDVTTKDPMRLETVGTVPLRREQTATTTQLSGATTADAGSSEQVEQAEQVEQPSQDGMNDTPRPLDCGSGMCHEAMGAEVKPSVVIGHAWKNPTSTLPLPYSVSLGDEPNNA